MSIRYGHVATRAGHLALIELLLDNGASIDQRTNAGATPLHVSAEAGRPEVIALLLKRGARLDSRRSDGRTPMQIAQRNGHGEAVRILRGWRGKRRGTNPSSG